MNLFFPQECLLNFFFPGEGLESFFSPEKGLQFFFPGSPPAPPPDHLCSSPWESLFVCSKGSLDFPSVNGMKRLSYPVINRVLNPSPADSATLLGHLPLRHLQCSKYFIFLQIQSETGLVVTTNNFGCQCPVMFSRLRKSCGGTRAASHLINLHNVHSKCLYKEKQHIWLSIGQKQNTLLY